MQKGNIAKIRLSVNYSPLFLQYFLLWACRKRSVRTQLALSLQGNFFFSQLKTLECTQLWEDAKRRPTQEPRKHNTWPALLQAAVTLWVVNWASALHCVSLRRPFQELVSVLLSRSEFLPGSYLLIMCRGLWAVLSVPLRAWGPAPEASSSGWLSWPLHPADHLGGSIMIQGSHLASVVGRIMAPKMSMAWSLYLWMNRLSYMAKATSQM